MLLNCYLFIHFGKRIMAAITTTNTSAILTSIPYLLFVLSFLLWNICEKNAQFQIISYLLLVIFYLNVVKITISLKKVS